MLYFRVSAFAAFAYSACWKSATQSNPPAPSPAYLHAFVCASAAPSAVPPPSRTSCHSKCRFSPNAIVPYTQPPKSRGILSAQSTFCFSPPAAPDAKESFC
ncbi:hypothetical protein GGI42DRAFT_315756 [Trichoderma sp. SZMC 28013]